MMIIFTEKLNATKFDLFSEERSKMINCNTIINSILVHKINKCGGKKKS